MRDNTFATGLDVNTHIQVTTEGEAVAVFSFEGFSLLSDGSMVAQPLSIPESYLPGNKTEGVYVPSSTTIISPFTIQFSNFDPQSYTVGGALYEFSNAGVIQSIELDALASSPLHGAADITLLSPSSFSIYMGVFTLPAASFVTYVFNVTTLAVNVPEPSAYISLGFLIGLAIVIQYARLRRRVESS